MPSRTLRALHPALRDDIADLMTHRPLPGPRLPMLDPFLFLNHHGPQTFPPGNRGLPFGPHPHRGFETVTFILEGDLAHLDSGGHESVIHAGGVQWMTAGRGVVHAELSPEAFQRKGGPLEILQLWVNLPSRLKMCPPAYVGLQAAEIPKVAAAEGATLELIAGRFGDTQGPIASLTGVFMSVLRLAPGARVTLPAPRGRTVFLYAVSGGFACGGQQVPAFNLAEVADDAEWVALEAGRKGAVALFGHADPIKEPVVSHGPFVMTTREEIAQAVRDYQAGRFGEVRV